MANTKTSLKESSPVKYYKRKKHVLSAVKLACNLFPAISILVTYAVFSCTGGALTNPLIPWKFTLGVILLVVGIIYTTAHELREITKQNKKDGSGADFSATATWLYVGLTLWLLYVTIFYLIIFCFIEVIGSFGSALCSSAIKECEREIAENKTAETNAKAMVREMKKEKQVSAIE